MNLLTIQEPKNSKEKNVCLGIDFGTTNSVCSVILNEKVSFIKDEKSNKLIPTIVYYKNGIKKFGNNITEKEVVNSIRSVKRNFLKNPDNKIFFDENEKKIKKLEGEITTLSDKNKNQVDENTKLKELVTNISNLINER